MLKFLTFPETPNNAICLLNFKPSLAIFQVPKYMENDFQYIFKTVLKVRLPIAHSLDKRTAKSLLKQTFKPSAPDIYKNKSHINFYNFIQSCKNYFTISEF